MWSAGWPHANHPMPSAFLSESFATKAASLPSILPATSLHRKWRRPPVSAPYVISLFAGRQCPSKRSLPILYVSPEKTLWKRIPYSDDKFKRLTIIRAAFRPDCAFKGHLYPQSWWCEVVLLLLTASLPLTLLPQATNKPPTRFALELSNTANTKRLDPERTHARHLRTDQYPQLSKLAQTR